MTRSKNFSLKNKGWPVILHPTKKQRNRGGNAITQPRSHPLENAEFMDGWD